MSGKPEDISNIEVIMQIKTGQATNLPWWRLQNMSDEEIEKHNDSFMMIERLHDNEQLKIVGMEKAIEENKFLHNRNISVLEKEIWNRAIEAAANIAEEWANDTASEIRKLKK